MKHTTFVNEQWKNHLFKTIGYDKESKTLAVYLQSGAVQHFFNVDESTVYELIIATDKDTFYKSKLETRFPSARIDHHPFAESY